MTNDLTKDMFIELLHTFKCVHSVSLFDNAMVVTCVTPAGIIIYSIYEVLSEFVTEHCQNYDHQLMQIIDDLEKRVKHLEMMITSR